MYGHCTRKPSSSTPLHLPQSLHLLRSIYPARYVHSPFYPLCPPFFPQTMAYAWPLAFPPPLALCYWSWPPNPLPPGRNCSLPPLLFPHMHASICIALSLRCTGILVVRSQRQEAWPLHSPGQLQCQYVAIIWQATIFMETCLLQFQSWCQ